jgi:hypothetical protein
MSKTPKILLALALAAFGLTSAAGVADDSKSAAPASNKLIGTWKLVSGQYGGREFKYPAGTTMLKHVTPSQFMWVTYDEGGKVTGAAGGSYTLKGESYDEHIEYGLGDNYEVIKGQTHSFHWKMDKNQWFHSGKLASGLTIEEVWERVESK